METVHKKSGRLHIYVRQDKYKGELKSKNWVGRTYHNGKQKIVSSGTVDLDQAIVILEKWYDDIIANKLETNINKAQPPPTETQAQPPPTETQAQPPPTETQAQPPPTETTQAQAPAEKNINRETQNKSTNDLKSGEKNVKLSIFAKFKNIKFSKKEKKVGNNSKNLKINQIKDTFQKFFKSKVSKMSVAGEEIVGIDISPDAIHVAQVNKDKDEKWILDKFSYRLLDKEKIGDNLLENKDYLSDEIKLALANAKITTTNVALSIPVTSAIIQVVTSPLMSEEELTKAIETDSLWDNLVQITDNLNDYSIFHQVINRNSKNNTMEILFVASKLSDVNAFSSIIKKASLNPVIMDVRCFTLKNAYDNISISGGIKQNSAIMEFGLEENYLMIIHNNTPIITHIFLRPQEKQSILEANLTKDNDESQNVIRRYAMQIKQAISDYEAKYESKINSINIVSNLKNVKELIPLFTKNLPTTGFKMFNPLVTMSIPEYNKAKINNENTSILTSSIGLAFRKLDVFGYYKFVTAVKNINLLPNRDAVKQQNKMKFLSGFALKGVAGAVGAIYLFLIIFSFFQINFNKEKLLAFDQIQAEFNKVNEKYTKLDNKKNEMIVALKLGNKVTSNQSASYRALAQITRSVPVRVQFSKLEFDGAQNITINGSAFSDQDILNFIANLNEKSLIEQASLASMNVPTTEGEQSSANKKGFTILCKLKGV